VPQVDHLLCILFIVLSVVYVLLQGQIPGIDNTESTASQVVADLNLLLTGSRLNDTFAAFITNEYNRVLTATGNAVAALQYAQKMVIFAPEFHTTNANLQTKVVRPPIATDPSQGRPAKNVIVLFLNGGLDSFGLLVPDPSCALYNDYAALRTTAALTPAQLLSLPSLPAGNSQPCTKFAVTSQMPHLASRFAAGDAAFVANVGPMIQPVTKGDFLGTSGVKVRLPPSLFAHNIQQQAIQNLDPANLVAKGVLGRISAALQSPPLKMDTVMYSLAGSLKVVEGAEPLQFVDPWGGLPQLFDLPTLANAISNFTQNQSTSVFAETYSSLLQDTIRVTSSLGPMLQSTTTNVTFGTDWLSNQFHQVAKLIKLQGSLKSERSLFVAEAGGFDTHESFVPPLAVVDTALNSLVQELITQGVWDSTVIVTISEFGRTLTSNGLGAKVCLLLLARSRCSVAGTDHSWGGNSVIMGGSVRGGQVFGQFPSSFAQGDANPLDLGRGRLLPTTPWESVWNAVATWVDVPSANISFVLPNAQNFPSQTLFTRSQLFKN
jgi:uncharacterized protein (DUF1501 family)